MAGHIDTQKGTRIVKQTIGHNNQRIDTKEKLISGDEVEDQAHQKHLHITSSVFDEDSESLSPLTIRVPATPDVGSSFGQYTVTKGTAIDNFNPALPESLWLNAVVTILLHENKSLH
uniref:Uncharacterized protein n=1 Tax=Glossina austeni TaxID=7395 RepID=A0A1A9USL1_GLOAU